MKIKSIVLLMLVLAFSLFVNLAQAQDDGTIVLEKSLPNVTVLVNAKKQIILKPGFKTSSSLSNLFTAKISNYNNISPTIPISSLSTIVVPNEFSSSNSFIKISTYLTGSTSQAAKESVQYFDGLGNPTQLIAVGESCNGGDIITSKGYDYAGREDKQFLQVPVNNNFGQIVSESILNIQRDRIYGQNNRPYVQTIFEESPLNRVVGNRKAGIEWSTHSINKEFTLNDQFDDNEVVFFRVNSNQELERYYFYQAGMLKGEQTIDEDGRIHLQYKDKYEKVVLTVDDNNVKTAYVYNDLGQLCYVLPPLAVDALLNDQVYTDNNQILKKYAYLYKYDERGNCIMKRMPGCNPIYMVYDKADRLVMSKDGNQQKLNMNKRSPWTVMKYDSYGRMIYKGIQDRDETDSISIYESIRKAISNVNVNEVYNGFASSTPLVCNYYDHYNFINNNDLEYDNSQHINGYTPQWSNATGLLTGTRVYLLDGSGNYTTTVNYYDEDEHIVQSRSTNHLGGYDYVYNQYDFTGKILKTLKKHKIATSAEVSELYLYKYDHGQRLLTTSYSLNGAIPVVLTSNTYDELGRVKEKTRHNGKENGSIEYNIQNWPTKIQTGDFVETLNYNKDLPAGTTPCYNGNIAYSTWTYKGETRGYRYNYDGLNRLEWAQYRVNGTEPYSYNETYTYDKMGNILNLERLGEDQTIDYLNYTYNGNQVTSIMDDYTSQNSYSIKEYQDKAGNSQNEMSYDANGNMVKDLDRDIVSIRYNVLNLPDVIQFKNGNQIKNLYDASGKKLGTEYFTQLTNIAPLADGQIVNQHYISGAVDQYGTAYIGNFEYKTLNGTPSLTTLTRIYNDEGYVENLSNPQYYYYRRDHLNDDREVWLANTNTVVQRTQYYPSGLPWAYQSGDNPDLQHRKYNNKEFVEMHGYDTYDIVWRQYYPSIMRFQTPDPEVEQFYDLSPYSMCGNNMVMNVDPDGRVLETGWDIVSLATGVASLASNIKQGNVGAAIVDGVGVIADAAAVIAPGIPGGAGAAIKAIRGGEKVVEAVKAVKTEAKVVKAVKEIGPAGDAGGKVMKQLPEAMQTNAKTTKGGTVFKDPANPKGNNVRVQSGNKKSPNPAQQKPYVKETRNGAVVNKEGKPTKSDSPDSHIPKKEYRYNR